MQSPDTARARSLGGRLAPAIIGVVFVALAVGLVVLYRGGDDGSSPEPSSAGGGIAAAGPAPAFTLPAIDGSTISLAEFRGENNVLLFFNEGTM